MPVLFLKLIEHANRSGRCRRSPRAIPLVRPLDIGSVVIQEFACTGDVALVAQLDRLFALLGRDLLGDLTHDGFVEAVVDLLLI